MVPAEKVMLEAALPAHSDDQFEDLERRICQHCWLLTRLSAAQIHLGGPLSSHNEHLFGRATAKPARCAKIVSASLLLCYSSGVESKICFRLGFKCRVLAAKSASKIAPPKSDSHQIDEWH